jgi:predicted aspartyl protease
MRSLKISLILAASITLIDPTFAEDQCPKLALVSSNDMHIGNDGRIYISAEINGTPKSMLIDTGGGLTEISQAAVDELKLHTHRGNYELIGVSGQTTDTVAAAPFKLGNLTADSMTFWVMPDREPFASDVPDAAGILAPNVLSQYDVDFDFGGKKFNLLSQDHCDGQVVYWSADSVAVVPIQIISDHHIVVPIAVDGHQLRATLDTGATETTMNLGTAELEFGVNPGAQDTPSTGHLYGNDKALTYSHRFNSLEFGGITMNNPQIDLIPDMVSQRTANETRTPAGDDSRIPDRRIETALPELIIGMNLIRHLHLYIAYKEKKLYITSATPPVAAATAQATH